MKLKLLIVLLSCFIGLNVSEAQRRADKKYELKAFNLAIAEYKRYIGQFPSSSEAMSKLADCYRHINQLDEAVEWYERAFSASQTIDPIHFLYYGKALMGIGKYDEAAREFRRYAQLNPELGNHFYEKAIYAKRNQRRRSKFGLLPLEGLNTAASDFCPAFFRGDQIIYSSARSDAGRSTDNLTGKSKNQLFIASYKDVTGRMEADRLLFPNGNNMRESIGPVSYSANGRTVVITYNNFIDGTRHLSSSGMKLDLYIAETKPDGTWQNPEPFPWNSATFSTGFGFLAEDGNTLYYASDRPGGIGGFDIYVSYRTSSTWSTPELLDQSINTPGDEITPYFDGRTLYFASDWHDGYGGYDIFRSDRQNQQWTPARNMGVGINSPKDDYGFIFDGVRNLGYFTSNRNNSKGSEDIYMISRQTNEVVVQVLNASDGRPVEDASIDFSDCQKGVFTTDASGTLRFRAEEDMNCQVIIRKGGYLSSSIDLNSVSLSRQKNYSIQLQKEDEQYSGNVVDIDLRMPIANVNIQAMDQATGQVVKTIADESGAYTLPMQPNKIYTIRYSKVGYADAVKQVQTGDGRDRFILGTMEIKQVGSATPMPEQPTFEVPPTTSNNQEISLQNLPPVGHAIQVAAVRAVDLNDYQQLGEYGNVYYEVGANVYKVRIGVFTTKAEANQILASVKKDGFKGAFLVQEVMEDVYDKVILPVNYAPQNVSLERGNNFNSIDGYKVQVAAAKNPNKNINTSNLNSLGVIEKKPKGQWTVWLLTGYETIDEAKQAALLAQERGFKGAFVVLDENGKISRVKV